MFQRKGQMLSLEQMILFSAGVVITLTVFTIFSNISENVREEAQVDQLKEVGSTIAGAIAAASGNEDIIIRVQIPQKIGAAPYSVDLNSENLTMILGDTRMDVPLEGIGSINTLSGTISSSAGRVIVTKASNTITITR